MKFIKSVVLIMLSYTILLPGISDMNRQKQFLKGYETTIRGKDFEYHSFIPDAGKSILVRAMQGMNIAEWKTQTIPSDLKQTKVTFIWVAGLSKDPKARKFDLHLNGNKILTFHTGPKENWTIKGGHGSELKFQSMLKDKYDDHFGYMFLTVPQESIQKGEKQTLKVVANKAESRSWYMTFKYNFQKVAYQPQPALLEIDNKPYQLVKASINNLAEKGTAEFKVGKQEVKKFKLQPGYNSFDLYTPEVKKPHNIEVIAKIGGEKIRKKLQLKPIIQREIRIIHHSHVDIGYTHVQPEVEKMQYENIKQALDIISRTSDYPQDAQFRWNVEVLWAVEAFLERASKQEIKQFEKAIKSGHIGMQGLYGNILTWLCSLPELWHCFDYAHELEERFGIQINSAMITDIPGYCWGIVPAMLKNGIKYFSSGPNNFDRIGGTLSDWGDRPFYWESPSGEDSLLTWVAGKGYALFHSWKGGAMQNTGEHKILNYCRKLSSENYPYEMVQLRYTISSDNGPPDSQLSDFVKEWNQKYISPKLVISTDKDMFEKFEKRNHDQLPVVRGDFTPFWEDGAFSTARTTIMNRKNAERIIQTQTLSLIINRAYPFQKFSKVWRNLLLYDEHTWGAHNSVSDPDKPFVKKQWNNKKAFAEKADRILDDIYFEAFHDQDLKSEFIEVFNTSSWQRSGPVIISSDYEIDGNLAIDSDGSEYPVQKLSNGDFIFLAENIPPLGSKVFKIVKQKSVRFDKIKAENNILSNGQIETKLDQKGNIASLKWNGKELIEKSGFNKYYYLPGKNPDDAVTIDNGKIKVQEQGPVFSSLLVESTPPGCKKMQQEVRLYNSKLNWIEIVNTLDKKAIRDKESVHFAFPFDIPDGQVRLHIPGEIIEPEKDQLKGANRNFISLDKGLDISNQDFGVTLATVDASLIEIGDMHAEHNHWMKHLAESQKIYSYALNNYWHTNYKSDQNGIIKYEYVLKPHGKFDQAAIQKFNLESARPFQIRRAKNFESSREPLFFVENQGIIVEEISLTPDIDSKIHLRNITNKKQKLRIQWNRMKPQQVKILNPQGQEKEIEELPELASQESITLIAKKISLTKHNFDSFNK